MRRTPALFAAGTLATSAFAASLAVASHGGLLGLGGGPKADVPALAGANLPATTTTLPPEEITQYVDVPVTLPDAASPAAVAATEAASSQSDQAGAEPDDRPTTTTSTPPASSPTPSYEGTESEHDDSATTSSTEPPSTECTDATHDC